VLKVLTPGAKWQTNEMTIHLHLVLRLRMVKLYLCSQICLHGMVVTKHEKKKTYTFLSRGLSSIRVNAAFAYDCCLIKEILKLASHFDDLEWLHVRRSNIPGSHIFHIFKVAPKVISALLTHALHQLLLCVEIHVYVTFNCINTYVRLSTLEETTM
jgi:hypothetical protein